MTPPPAIRQLVLLLAGASLLAACRSGGALPRDGWEPAPVLNIGHRGASGHAPEHTLVAYDLALRMGAHYIEQDLQMTGDGVLVVLHDPTLDRTARGPAEHCTGRVIDRTLAQIRSCEVGSWFHERPPGPAPSGPDLPRIPTLEEVLQRYGSGARYYIETKNPEEAPGMEEALVGLLGRHGLLDARARGRVLVQSFSSASLQRLHELAPDLPLVQLFDSRETSETIRGRLEAVRHYAVGIGPAKGSVDRALVEAARRRCLRVHPYTVNEPEEMRRLLELGVDGMFTNFPDRLDTLLAPAFRSGPLRTADRGEAGRPRRSGCGVS